MGIDLKSSEDFVKKIKERENCNIPMIKKLIALFLLTVLLPLQCW